MQYTEIDEKLIITAEKIGKICSANVVITTEDEIWKSTKKLYYLSLCILYHENLFLFHSSLYHLTPQAPERSEGTR